MLFENIDWRVQQVTDEEREDSHKDEMINLRNGPD
jgi:hypothetical protein